jgi:hypothetical protein
VPASSPNRKQLGSRRRGTASSWSQKLVAVIVGIALAAGTAGLISAQLSRKPDLLPTVEAQGEPIGGNQWRYWPQSPPAELGTEYLYEVDHCGLRFLTDFDGSFWLPDDRQLQRVDPALVRALVEEDLGTLVLTDKSDAVYTTSSGVEIPLSRVPGPRVSVPCT